LTLSLFWNITTFSRFIIYALCRDPPPPPRLLCLPFPFFYGVRSFSLWLSFLQVRKFASNSPFVPCLPTPSSLLFFSLSLLGDYKVVGSALAVIFFPCRLPIQSCCLFLPPTRPTPPFWVLFLYLLFIFTRGSQDLTSPPSPSPLTWTWALD